MRKSNIKTTLLVVVFGLLLLPFLQSKFNLFKLESLNGAISQVEINEFSLSEWFSGEFQEKREEYLNHNFGFRSWFIRVNNQISFSLFNNANSVIIGKENYLYEENYIKAVYGRDFITRRKIEEKLEKVKYLQDTLSKMDKNIMLVFAPGKGSYYPEYIPDKFITQKDTTNYSTYIALADEFNLNYIDFNKYFIDMKKDAEHPLFPQYGIHWSLYGGYIAADSIVKYIEQKRNINMPDYSFKDYHIDQPIGTDYDIADGMNILCRLKTYDMAYPILEHFPEEFYHSKPSLLTIADSYYWTVYRTTIVKTCFSPQHFWFYNKTAFPATKTTYTKDLDLKNEIESHDVIIILATDASLPRMGWSFIDSVYELYKPKDEISSFQKDVLSKIAAWKNAMKSDDIWMNQISLKAAKNEISIDSMMTLDALWLIEKENK